MDNNIYIDTELKSITTQTSSKVIFPKFISFIKGGKEMAALDIEADFSKLPPEYHMQALRLLKSQGVNLWMQADEVNTKWDDVKKKYDDEKKSTSSSIFKKLKNLLTSSW